MTLYKILLILSLAVMPIMAADHKNLSIATTAAQLAYQQAVLKIESDRALLLAGKSISFVEVHEEPTGESKSTAKLLSLTSSGEEHITLLDNSTQREAQTGLNWESSLLINPARFPDNPALINETETTWIFHIPTMVSADIDDTVEQVDNNKVNARLTSALTSELTVSKQSLRFVSLKTYSKQAFKPESLVKISKFHVKIDYGQTWPDGPWVAKSISRVVKGSYAFFMTVDESSNTKFLDFRMVKQPSSP
ncbi:hypothetical protein [Pseudoalteromonas aurantia]|uniref:Uncharacterized protein n=1 Tax=Pseudoalteromonas aurantia 208 TaxID=1314867 RepID=A0ABR9EH29_9GAMM|nr:hypothetical protein [Pseudoalteromonas aurantia]MBE0369048.1 hypothetical protein [Pseudoalteromonas aurantia 208]